MNKDIRRTNKNLEKGKKGGITTYKLADNEGNGVEESDGGNKERC